MGRNSAGHCRVFFLQNYEVSANHCLTLGAMGKTGGSKAIAESKACMKRVSGLRMVDASAGSSTIVARILSECFVTLHFRSILILCFNGIRDFGFGHAP